MEKKEYPPPPWGFYPSADGFLMISIQSVCGKAILMCLIPNLIGLHMMALSALSPLPFKALAPINKVKEVLFIKYLVLSTVRKNVLNMDNSADVDETPHYAASQLGPRYL